MNDLSKHILLKFDEINRYETPSNFDHKNLEHRVMVLLSDLESHFGTRFKIDNHVQDASFYGDIIIPAALVNDPVPSCHYSIRISNFGSMATFTFEDSYSDVNRKKFIDMLQKHHFIYIASDDLEEEYDGQFKKFNEILGGPQPSWWIRYFDYL
jgi:hypothetical protein